MMLTVIEESLYACYSETYVCFAVACSTASSQTSWNATLVWSTWILRLTLRGSASSWTSCTHLGSTCGRATLWPWWPQLCTCRWSMSWTLAGSLSRPGELLYQVEAWEIRGIRRDEKPWTLHAYRKKKILYNVSQPTFPLFLYTSALTKSCAPANLTPYWSPDMPCASSPPALSYSLDMPFPPSYSVRPCVDASSSVDVFMIITQLFLLLFLSVPKPLPIL